MIESNSDHAQFKPAVNRTVICFGEWKQHPILADLDSYMNGYADPRRAGMDGLVLRFSGSVTAAAAALEPQIVQRLATLNDKMLAFEDNAGFVTAAGDVYTVGSQVDYWTGYYGIEAGRILPVVALTGTLADEQGPAQ